MSVPQEEKELLNACIRGDPSAWDAFVDRYSSFLHGAIRKVLARAKGRFTTEESEAVYQDVFWELFREGGRALRGFAGRSKLTTYLWVIAYRKTMELVVSRGRLDSRASSIDEVPEPDAGVDEPADLLSRSETRSQVRKALAQLPEKDRAILTLFYYESLPHAEIARQTGQSPASIGMIIHRGRKKLEKILKKAGKRPL